MRGLCRKPWWTRSPASSTQVAGRAPTSGLIDRAIDDAIGVLPLAVAGDFNEAMKRLHTSRTP